MAFFQTDTLLLNQLPGGVALDRVATEDSVRLLVLRSGKEERGATNRFRRVHGRIRS
jgi:hypothetical protein